MPKHIIQKAKDTEVNILAIGAANEACEGQLYFATDTQRYYYGLTDGSLFGPLARDLSGLSKYASDGAAASGGVAVGEFYIADAGHIEGAIEGTLKQRIV